MRFRAIVPFAFSIISCVTALVGLVSSSGCGSSHGTSPSSTPTPVATPTPAIPTAVQATIVWPTRSRQTSTGSVQIAALASAGSAQITLNAAQPSGANVVILANRPSSAAGGAITYASTTTAVPGTYLLTVQFYNLPLTSSGAVNPSAVVVGTAQANALVESNGTLSATITTVGQIQSIQVLPGQTIPLNSSADIQYTAYGPTNNGVQTIIPVAAGVAQVSVVNTNTAKPPVAEVLTGPSTGGMVEGIAPGTAIVTVTVDNVTNDTTAASSVITVVSNASVAIVPNVAQVLISSTEQFSAVVANPSNQQVTWSLSASSPAGGSIDPVTGIFTAPNASGGTYTVVATSQYDPTKSGTATITVVSNVSIVPTGGTTTVFVGANKTIALPVTVTGSANTGVVYSVVGNAGTSTANGSVTAAGVYTAPDTEGIYQVTVTSDADTSKFVTFSVNVGPSVTISPKKTTLSVEQSITFNAHVVGGTSNAVIFTASGGSINSTSGQYTAPDTVGTYTVTATSVQDPSQSDTATVTVQAGSGVIVVQ